MPRLRRRERPYNSSRTRHASSSRGCQGLGLAASAAAPGGRAPEGRVDSRWADALDRDATLLAGLVVIVILIAMCFWEWAHGRDGSPYSQIATIGGVAYILAYAGLHLRR